MEFVTRNIWIFIMILYISACWWIVGNERTEQNGGRKSMIGEYYLYTMEQTFVRMSDGIDIAVTLVNPIPKFPNETFPVLLEYSPYRKDDSSYLRDYENFHYFGRRGFIVAKVDVRGTGKSFGSTVFKEYSEQELQDGLEIIDFLSKLKQSNGNVGMFGMSWSGFNSLMLAMRNPKPLKCIVAIHASDDLYHDDVHYVDGIFHISEYSLHGSRECTSPESRISSKQRILRKSIQSTTMDYAISESTTRWTFLEG